MLKKYTFDTWFQNAIQKEGEGEVWEDVVFMGLTGLYYISNYGRVRGENIVKLVNNKLEWSEGKIHQPSKHKQGYWAVNFSRCGIMKSYKNHRLVATAFRPNPENKPEVNHLDGDKENTFYKNLEWSTGKENVQHAFANGLNKYTEKNAPYLSKPIIQYDKHWNKITEFPSLAEVVRQMPQSQQRNIWKASKCNYMAYGYHWRFKDDAEKNPPIYIPNKSSPKAIIKCLPNGTPIEEFSSKRSAFKNGKYSPASISVSINTGVVRYGFLWKLKQSI